MAGLIRPARSDRAQVLCACQEVMGPLRPRTSDTLVPLDIRDEHDAADEDEDDERLAASGVSRTKISFMSEAGDRISAYLCMPRASANETSAAPAPAMVCLHGTSGGDGGIVGVRGSYGSYGEYYGAHGDDPGMHYGLELAERGFVTISPDYIFLASRKSEDEPQRLQQLGWQGGTIKGIWDHMRAVDVLLELSMADGTPAVDPSRIGSIGCSLGGHNSLFLAAFDTRVKLVVTSCGFDSFITGRCATEPEKQIAAWAQHRYMPKVATVFDSDPHKLPWDFPDLLAIIAPRPVYIHAAADDHNFLAASVRQCVEVAGAAITADGMSPEQCIVACYPPGGHGFPQADRELGYEFVEERLGGDQHASL